MGDIIFQIQYDDQYFCRQNHNINISQNTLRYFQRVKRLKSQDIHDFEYINCRKRETVKNVFLKCQKI